MTKKSTKKTPGKIIGIDGQEIKPAKKPTLGVVKTFRLSEADAAIFDQKVALAGMNHSEFFRLAVIQNKSVVHEKVRMPSVNREAIHLLLKQGNNLNQIARSLNEAKLAGTITAATFKSVLSELSEMNDTAKSIINFVKG